jgi:nitrate/nitrite transporter NarK
MDLRGSVSPTVVSRSSIGRLITYGPVPVLYPCSRLCIFALCMTSLATEYYQIFLAQGLAFGIGAGCVFTAAMPCVGRWFVRQRGLATGIASAGSSVGSVIFTIFLNRIVDYVGVYGTVRCTAFFVGVMLAISCCLVRARLPRTDWNSKAKWFDISLFKDRKFVLYTIGAFFVM